MQKIEIDDEVFAHLQSKAIPYVETPNLTLRRLLRLDRQLTSDPITKPQRSTQKKPKAKLENLVSNGTILFLYDYQRNRIPGYDVPVVENQLEWDGKLYSMSNLARILLKEKGYSSESVRGPAHWYTQEGQSIMELWEEYLEMKDQIKRSS